MTEKIKKGDFVELTYTGRVKSNNEIFDLNDEKVAKENNLHNPKMKYEPTVVCVGRREVIEGLDDALDGKHEGEEFEISIVPEKAFGKRDSKLYQLVNAAKFKKSEMTPVPGMSVTINNMPAIIRSVSGGRIMVDFNHPLAGKEVSYKVRVGKLVRDPQRQVASILKVLINRDVKVTVEGEKASVDFEVPEQIAKEVEKGICECVSAVKMVEFKKPAAKKELSKKEQEE